MPVRANHLHRTQGIEERPPDDMVSATPSVRRKTRSPACRMVKGPAGKLSPGPRPRGSAVPSRTARVRAYSAAIRRSAPFARADVANGGGNKQALVGSQGTEADFRRELRAVLASPEQLQHFPPRPWQRVSQESGAVFDVVRGETQRDQNLDGLADELVPVVAERSLGLRVHPRNAPVPVNHQNRHRGGLEDAVGHFHRGATCRPDSLQDLVSGVSVSATTDGHR